MSVVVTGATGGVGRAVARAFGARGARVALLARGDEGLAAAADDVREAGGEPLPLSVDMSTVDEVEAAAAKVEQELGPVNVWVNTAFTAILARFTDISPDEYRRVTDVTYHGYVYGTMAALKYMRPRDRGTIVQVGSALAYRGIPLQTAYCGAKHAIQGFTESLRCELLHENSKVRVTMVQLPGVNTPQFSWALVRLPRRPQPVPPIYQPELAARGILYAADHPRRREYWVGTSTALTIAANAIAPGLLDRYLARTAFDAQQTEKPTTEHDPVNLWEPADTDTDFGAHGRFDSRAHGRDPQLWASQHHSTVLLAAGALATVATAAVVRSLRRR